MSKEAEGGTQRRRIGRPEEPSRFGFTGIYAVIYRMLMKMVLAMCGRFPNNV